MSNPYFRHESSTSREAAQAVDGARKGQEEVVYDFIHSKGVDGATIDEIAEYMTAYFEEITYPGTASARVAGLRDDGRIKKTGIIRKTRRGKPANAHVALEFFDKVVEQFIEQTAPKPEKPMSVNTPGNGEDSYTVQQFKKMQAKIGHGWIVPRADGTKEGCGGSPACRSCYTADQYYKHIQRQQNKTEEK